MTQEINFYSRKEEYGWLSNFWRSSQTINNIEYPTNEHYYQSQKARDLEIKKWITNAPNPYLAMKAGRSLREGKELRHDWNNRKVQTMLIGLREKFNQNAELKQKLLDTGDSILHEDSPIDMFWGKKGKDLLGKLIVRVRKEIRQEETKNKNLI